VSTEVDLALPLRRAWVAMQGIARILTGNRDAIEQVGRSLDAGSPDSEQRSNKLHLRRLCNRVLEILFVCDITLSEKIGA
jgi:hypothetical protein